MLFHRSVAGFTLIEVMISTLILSTVIGAALMLSMTSQKAVTTDMIWSNLEDQGRSLMENIIFDLRYAETASLIPTLESLQTNPSDSLQVRKVETYNRTTGQMELSAPLEYRTEPVDGETLGDGIDNNSNGLIDERKLMRIQNGISVLMCRNVRRLQFQTTEVAAGQRNLKISLTLVGRDRPRNQEIEIPFESSMFLRN